MHCSSANNIVYLASAEADLRLLKFIIHINTSIYIYLYSQHTHTEVKIIISNIKIIAQHKNKECRYA